MFLILRTSSRYLLLPGAVDVDVAAVAATTGFPSIIGGRKESQDQDRD
jgi:hypothetical protein